MTTQIKVINLGGVNCYLLTAGNGFVLIDTGFSNKRDQLVKDLENAGCRPGNLQWIVLTHGDIDHVGNAAYLRQKFGAKIAMHADDLGIVEGGNMGWNRKAKPDKISGMSRLIGIIGPLFGPGKFETFTPDLTIDEGYDLSAWGLDAKVIYLPGHSKGSIGILVPGGDPSAASGQATSAASGQAPSAASGQVLFCGDLIYNFFGKPDSSYIDNLADFNDSLEKLKKLTIKTVYPGHGSPFPMEKFFNE